MAAMKHIENNTCIRFVPRTTEKNYLTIASQDTGCWAEIGYTPGVNVSMGD
jgi:hypothetical protein